jgi:hypothetical protein
VTTGVAGATLVGSGLLMAATGLTTSPRVQLASVELAPVELVSVECSLDDAVCANGLFGDSAATPVTFAAASATANPLADIYGFFFGNGTPENPNAGLLVGDGYSFTADDVGDTPYCVEGSPCNGGNAGLLFGKGGNGYDGGSGGNAYFYGRGGNGGNAVDFGLPNEDNFGGDGGNGGFLGGTDADGKPWLGVFFDCCRVYSRAHRNAAGSHYIGHCPRCAARVQFKIGEGGSGARFWTAR